MRRLLFLPVLLLCITTIFAQPGFGPELGLGVSTMHFEPPFGFTSASTSAEFSGKIGGVADFKASKHIYFQPGIFFSRKGQSREFSFYTSDSLNLDVHQTLMINYIDVPVNLVYKTGIQGRGRVIFGAGVVPSYIIGGRNKQQRQGVSDGVPFNNSTNTLIASGNPLALFDIGVNTFAGYELPTGLFFRAYYTAGVRDIGLGGEVDKNRVWGVSCGYLFGKGHNINKEADDLIDKSTD